MNPTGLSALACLVVAFLIGSIPTALLLGRLRGVDIREHGSGNVGATNAMRVLGRGWGLACLLADILKGCLPALLPMAEFLGLAGPIDAWMWAFGLAAIAGHMFSPWLRFRGGKGVATSLGVMLAIAPIPMLVAFFVGALMIWLTGYVSLASMTGAALMPVLILAEALVRHPGVVPWTSIGVTLFLGALVIWKHRGNIQRLRDGTEQRLFGGAATSDEDETPTPNTPAAEAVEIEVEADDNDN